MIAAILRVYYVLVQKAGQTAAIWSCREDVIAILVGQATMIRSIFTKRFWGIQQNTGYSGGSGSYQKKNTHGSEGHEMSVQSGSRPSRLGFTSKKPKDPYNVSVLETRNESEEAIVEPQKGPGFQFFSSSPPSQYHETGLRENPLAASRMSEDKKDNYVINVQKTVDIETVTDPEGGYPEGQKPNYGHNSRIHNKWQPF